MVGQSIASNKTCNKCGHSGPPDDFHRDKRTADGRTQTCKKCNCERARRARNLRIEYWRSHDRERSKTPRRKQQNKMALLRKRSYNPARAKAHWTVANALRSGTLIKSPCEVCGSLVVDAHHNDYSKPLEVRWLCRTHHCELHARAIAARRCEEAFDAQALYRQGTQ